MAYPAGMALGFDRRRFLRGGCALVLVGCRRPAGGGDDSAAVDSGTSSTSTSTSRDDTATTPPPPSYPCGQEEVPGEGWSELSFAQWPDLAVVGGWYAVDVAGLPLVVAQVEEGCWAAVDRRCTHEGADVEYRAERHQFVCPRHGAVYDADGTARTGPQPADLGHYPCVRAGDAVWVRPG